MNPVLRGFMAPASTVQASHPAKEAGVQPMRHFALLALFMAMVPPTQEVKSLREQRALQRVVLEEDDVGALNTGGALIIVGVIIGAVVGLAVLAALVPTFFSSLADIGAVFTDPSTTTGNADADALLPVFGLLIAFGGLFAIVGLALLVVAIKKKGA